MSIQISDLGFDIPAKVKNAIFKDGVLIEGDTVSPLLPFLSDPALAPTVGATLAKISQLREEALKSELANKDAEIQALKSRKRNSNKSDDDVNFDRTDSKFWSKISKDFEFLISQVIKDDNLEGILSQSNYPQFTLDRIWSLDLFSYFSVNMIESGAFEGITGNSKNLTGYCKKVNRVKCNQWISSLIDDWQWKVEKHFNMLYLLKLALDKIFETANWEHTYTPRLNQSFKQEMNLVSQEDWDWLHSAESDCLFETPRTAKWSVDKQKLESLFNQLETLLEVNNDNGIDLQAYSKIVSELIVGKDSLIHINKAVIKRLLESKGKKHPVILNPVFKLAEVSEETLTSFNSKKEIPEEGESAPKSNKKSRLTA